MGAVKAGPCAADGCDKPRVLSRARCHEHLLVKLLKVPRPIDWATYEGGRAPAAGILGITGGGPNGKKHGHVVAEVRFGPGRQVTCSCGELLTGQPTDRLLAAAFMEHRVSAEPEAVENRPAARTPWSNSLGNLSGKSPA